jgi:predicted phosphodiesterase
VKIMMLGDTHGDRGFTTGALRYCADNQIDRVIQVGDFGFWPRINNGQRFLYSVASVSAEVGVPLYFIDGNHEDHTYLSSMVKRSEDGFVPFKPNYCDDGEVIWYIPRGTRFEIEGTVFGAFGGAFSIDRHLRGVEGNPQFGWFSNEVPDETKIENLGTVDVLLTHDSPTVPPSMFNVGFKKDPDSEMCQKTVRAALNASRAKLLVHGHWHVNDRYVVDGVPVQALDMNGSSLYDAAVVFDTETKTLYTIREWNYRDAR